MVFVKRKKIKKTAFNNLPNGVLYLKGGVLKDEFEKIRETPVAFPIREFFDFEDFDQKYVIHVPVERD